METEAAMERMKLLERRLALRGGPDRPRGATRRACWSELQALRDQMPECANAHVLAWRTKLRAEAEGRLHKLRPGLAPDVEASTAAVVRTRRFENHMATAGLREGAAEGENRVTTHVHLPVNLQLLIGGLARIEGRLSEEQKQAAATYRGLYEASIIGGARATDYTQPLVDTSSGGANPADGGIDARRRYALAVQALGMIGSNLVERVVCQDVSIRQLARQVEGGVGDQARQRVTRRVLEAVDTLVDHFQLVARPGHGKLRFVGERPTFVGSAADVSVDDSGQRA